MKTTTKTDAEALSYYLDADQKAPSTKAEKALYLRGKELHKAQGGAPSGHYYGKADGSLVYHLLKEGQKVPLCPVGAKLNSCGKLRPQGRICKICEKLSDPVHVAAVARAKAHAAKTGVPSDADEDCDRCMGRSDNPREPCVCPGIPAEHPAIEAERAAWRAYTEAVKSDAIVVAAKAHDAALKKAEAAVPGYLPPRVDGTWPCKVGRCLEPAVDGSRLCEVHEEWMKETL